MFKSLARLSLAGLVALSGLAHAADQIGRAHV